MIHIVLRSPIAYQRALCRALHDYYKGEFVAWFEKDDPRTPDAPTLDGESFKFRVLSECGYRRLFHELKADAAAIVVLGSWSSAIAYNTILFSIFLRTPLFVWADHPHPSKRSRIGEYVGKLYLRILAKLVDGFLVCGQPTGNHLEQHLGIPHAKITNFPYWVNIPEEWSTPARCTSVQQQTPLHLIAIGRHVPVKCFEVAIEAVQISNHNAGKCIAVLDLVGDGPERERLEEFSKSLNAGTAVKFIGWQNNGEVWQLLRNADALVITSRFEPYGVVVLELLASGRPVLASSQVIAAIDRDDGSGAIRIHRVGDAEGLAQQIAVLAGSRDALLQSSRAARALAQKWPLELAPSILQTAIDEAARSRTKSAPVLKVGT